MGTAGAGSEGARGQLKLKCGPPTADRPPVRARTGSYPFPRLILAIEIVRVRFLFEVGQLGKLLVPGAGFEQILGRPGT